MINFCFSALSPVISEEDETKWWRHHDLAAATQNWTSECDTRKQDACDLVRKINNLAQECSLFLGEKHSKEDFPTKSAAQLGARE